MEEIEIFILLAIPNILFSAKRISDYMLVIIEAAIPSDEKDDIIDLHNSIRKMHSNTPSLRWNNALAQKSKLFVESCEYKDRENVLKLYKESSTLDNVARGYSNWSDTIAAWYKGEEDYDYDNPGYTKSAGTFITMIWKDSTNIGCSSFKCDDDSVLYQCLYSPSIPVDSLFNTKEYELNVRSPSSYSSVINQLLSGLD